MNKGLFISIEGPEGSGKSTSIKFIKERLINQGYKVIDTREPGGVDIAEQIRNVILDNKNKTMDTRCEALLYAAARRQHLIEVVIPALDNGKIVLCDRFIDSSLAYQGRGRGLGINDVYNLNKFAIDDLMPDKTLFFDIPVEIGLERIEKNHREVNRFDKEGINFHKEVYEGYMEVCKLYKDRISVINANQCVEDVVSECMEVIQELL